MNQTDRNTIWKDIWRRKGSHESTLLHHLDGYDLLSLAEWDRMIFQVQKPLRIQGNERILECGCGAGAFLDSLLRLHPEIDVTGIDYSDTLIAKAKRHFHKGRFLVADMTDLHCFPEGSFDHTVSFGTFIYLSSEASALLAITEMLRVTRPGGMLYVGEVSDAAKREEAAHIRRESHKAAPRLSLANPDHLFLPKDFFSQFAHSHESKAIIVDHTRLDLGDYAAARYRYSVYITKRGGTA